jgi:hypothetical protein
MLQQQNKGKQRQMPQNHAPGNPLKLSLSPENQPFYQSAHVMQHTKQYPSSALSKNNSRIFHIPHLSYSK